MSKKKTVDLNPFKMTKEELAIWLALRGKGHSIDSKKSYNRKQKHKKDLRYVDQLCGPVV